MEIVAHKINSRNALSGDGSLFGIRSEFDAIEKTGEVFMDRNSKNINQASRIEFDVIEQKGEVFLAHDLEDINNDTLRLQDALPLLQASNKDLMCDLKSYTPSVLEKVAQAFNSPCWQDRIIFTSHVAQDSRWLARQVPGARSAWSIPQINLTGVQVPTPRSEQDLLWWKANITERILPSLAFNACDIISTQFELAVPDLIEAAHSYNKQVYAWTITSPQQVLQMEQLGIDGVVVDY